MISGILKEEFKRKYLHSRLPPSLPIQAYLRYEVLIITANTTALPCWSVRWSSKPWLGDNGIRYVF